MALSNAPTGGPCGPARIELDTRCAEAERLAQAAVAHQQRLREARLELQRIGAQRDADARVRDRRQLSQTKDAARVAYHQEMVTAPNPAAVQDAARTWLRELDRLNRQLDTADRRAEELNRRSAELGQALPGIELAADAARIAAEAANEACVEARRALAACEEAAQRRTGAGAAADAGAATAGAASTGSSAGAPARPSPGTSGKARPGTRQITLVLRGDRDTLLGLALRLADETGIEAGRMQLLLLELREQIAVRALESNALALPQGHQFWSQFPADGARKVVASLASMGYRYDGDGGWADERIPTMRELALAVSHTGIDPRTLRRPPGQQQIDELWRGTEVMVEEFLAACAPSLELEQVMACLGPRAARLSELWDIWGRLRQMLLAAPSA